MKSTPRLFIHSLRSPYREQLTHGLRVSLLAALLFWKPMTASAYDFTIDGHFFCRNGPSAAVPVVGAQSSESSGAVRLDRDCLSAECRPVRV
jgi:hypothetical protein